MMQRFTTTLALFLILPIFEASISAQEKDPEKISGTWILESAELAGKKLPQDFVSSVSLIISGTSYSSRVGKLSDKGTLKLSPDSKPKEMDITSTEGQNQGKTFPAIYELSGNSLMICYDLEGKKRPEAFRSFLGNQVFLAVYKREKK